eukprot:TRINITY_DN4027_c0_g1_i3.p1 TRINITY_DN4027_c0_g1~~TRINITY_DN4027_c0_g1_i3.p1  ORF type:complete len:816 (+),score=82.62 TRINITY_DN4027_c0_g1_i3:2148-4595(+)
MAPHPEITFIEYRKNNWTKWPITFPAYGPHPWELPPQPINLERKSPGCLTLQFAARWLFTLLDIPAPDENGISFLTELATRIISNTGDCRGKPANEISTLLSDVASVLQHVLNGIRKSRAKVDSCDIDNDTIRHVCWISQIGLATLKGLLRDKPTTWEDLDHWDFLDWLLSNGFPSSLSHIPPVESVYISAFAWINGDMSKPDYAAGAALQTVLLTGGDYNGEWAYYMRGGTGDTLVLPLYQWLLSKGVQFKFFHRVVGMHPSPDGHHLEEIDIDVQAKLRDSSPHASYQPLIYVLNGTMEAWPSQPLWEQLHNGDALRQYNFESYWSSGYPTERLVLKRGIDFDVAISAISVGPLKYVAEPLMQASPAFNDMVLNAATTPTFSIQMWFDKTAAEMGAHGFSNDTFNVVGYAAPFDGCVDYEHVIPFENWQGQRTPNVAKDVLYWSLSWDPLPGSHPFNDSTYPENELEHLKSVAYDYMNKYLQPLYPGATHSDGSLDESRLVPGQSFANQFFKVNIDPSELYVLTPTNKTWFRLNPQNSTFHNLFLAGDYTFSGINIGCIESTVRSGIMAAQAVIAVVESSTASSWYVQAVDPSLQKVPACAPLFQRAYCTEQQAISAQQACRVAVPNCAVNPDFCFELIPSTSFCYPDAPTGCSNPVPGNCSWYSNCLESRYSCGEKGYPLGYGNYYCRTYFDMCPAMSDFGQKWCQATRTCLISTGAQLLCQPTTRNYTCEEVKAIAFNSHPACYTLPEASFCDLPPSDVKIILKGFRVSDLLSADTIKQMESIAKICLKQGRQEIVHIIGEVFKDLLKVLA